MPAYKNKNVPVLEKTLLSGPGFARKQYAARLEDLILEINEDEIFSPEYIYFRVTGFRPDRDMGGAASGRVFLHDLTLLLETVSRDQPIGVGDAAGQVLTSEQVADRLNVSRRTVYRWRRKGLPARIYVFPDGRKRAGFRVSSVEAFMKKYEAFVSCSSRFSRITETEQRDLINMLHRTVRARNCSVTEAARLVGEKTGRSPESIRLLFHGRSGVSGPGSLKSRPLLTEVEKRNIYRAVRAGVPVVELAEKYGKSRQTIYRTFNSMRAEELLGITAEPSKIILPEKTVPPGNLLHPGRMAGIWNDNRNPFLLYNMAKRRVLWIRKMIDPRRYVRTAFLDELELMSAVVKAAEMHLVLKHLKFLIDSATYHAGRGLPLNRLSSIALSCFFTSLRDYDYRKNRDFGSFLKLRLLKKFASVLPQENTYAAARGYVKPTVEERQEAVREIRAALSGRTADIREEIEERVVDIFGLQAGLSREDIEDMVQFN